MVVSLLYQFDIFDLSSCLLRGFTLAKLAYWSSSFYFFRFVLNSRCLLNLFYFLFRYLSFLLNLHLGCLLFNRILLIALAYFTTTFFFGRFRLECFSRIDNFDMLLISLFDFLYDFNLFRLLYHFDLLWFWRLRLISREPRMCNF